MRYLGRMTFANVTFDPQRKHPGREDVLVLRTGDGKEVHLHPGMNAVPVDLWDTALKEERAKKLVSDGVLKEASRSDVETEEAPKAPTPPLGPPAAPANE